MATNTQLVTPSSGPDGIGNFHVSDPGTNTGKPCVHENWQARCICRLVASRMSDILSLHESDSPSTRQCQEGGSAVGEIIMRLAEVKNRESILLTS